MRNCASGFDALHRPGMTWRDTLENRMRRALIIAPCLAMGLALLAWAAAAGAAPDEELLGKSAGYPIGVPATWYYDERVRVGSFSHLDEILPHYSLAKSAAPLPLPRAAAPSAI